MIVIQAGTTTYGISFAHPWLEPKKKNAPERATLCEIFQAVGDQRLDGIQPEFPKGTRWTSLICAEGEWSKSDNFERSAGRRKALTRALCQHDFLQGTRKQTMKCLKCNSPRTTTLTLPKDVRTAIWDGYFRSLEPGFSAPIKFHFKDAEIIPDQAEPLEYSPGLGTQPRVGQLPEGVGA